MVRVWRAVRVAMLGVVLASSSSAVLAFDPLVLFLLRMMRDQAASSAIEAGVSAAQEPEKPEVAAMPQPAPQAPPEERWLKGLIDESFLHLNDAQRAELYASMMKILADPRNAPRRSEIIGEFTRRAVAMRDAHRQLSRLSEADMKGVAAEAREEFARLPPDQRALLLKALERGVPGMPRELNDIMLAEFSSVPQAR